MADIMNCLPLERSSVQSAHKVIKHLIHETPVLICQTLDNLASTPQTPEALVGTPYEGQAPARPKINFFFKCENYQRIGAFKIRGASYALACLSNEELKNGVVTHSSGNHAQALALAARTRGIPAYIVMPTISTPSKIAATKGYGAEVIFSGSTSEEREVVVVDVIKRTNAVLVPPYDHPDIILGQGTMALEMEEQVQEMVRREPELSVHGRKDLVEVNGNGYTNMNGNSNSESTASTGAENRVKSQAHRCGQAGVLDAVIAPLGGGGMLSGIATALHGTPTRVYGAEPSYQGANDGQLSLQQNQRITSVKTLTIADGLRTPVGEIPWTIISDKRKLRGVYSVSEEQIVKVMKLVLERMKVVVEPSAVVGLAVALWDEGFRREVEREGREEGWDVGIVFSGGNVGVEALAGMFAAKKGIEERAEGKVGLDGGREVDSVAG
ncbi:hypothetical protein MMC30_006788 [Trapelia coarctata]|nr:hypothetical protein [Trapelia coarctata]